MKVSEKEVDILLVLPPMYQSGRIPDYNPKEPIGLMYLASVLRQNGYSVTIIDADSRAFSIERTIDKIYSYGSSIIGFSVLQRALPSLKVIVDTLRRRGTTSHICCGGITATLSSDQILDAVQGIDSVVIGEGEYTFLRLTQALLTDGRWEDLEGIAFRNNGKFKITKSPEKPDICGLPLPSREFLPDYLEKTNYATILASRGCYGACTFCSNGSFERMSNGSNWRGRSPESVVDEIEFLIREYGTTIFKFNDPNMFGPGTKGREHVLNICREIITRGINTIHLMGFCRPDNIDYEAAVLMRKAGFERLLLGMETSNSKTLILLGKGFGLETIKKAIIILREIGIDIIPGFMIFNPYTTIQSLKEDMAFLEEYGFTPELSKALRIFDGIPLQNILSVEDRLIHQSAFQGYHEYLVDRKIASIYYALKIVYVEWIDRLKRHYQNEIWALKKSFSFSSRENYYYFARIIFLLELELLKRLVYWTENEFTLREVRDSFDKLETRFCEIENFIGKTASWDNVSSLMERPSGRELSSRVFSILNERVICTFPEKYRWHDD